MTESTKDTIGITVGVLIGAALVVLFLVVSGSCALEPLRPTLEEREGR